MKLRPEISSLFLLRWLIQAVVAGAIACITVQIFQVLYTFGSHVLDATAISPLIWSIAAALLVGLFLYPLSAEAIGEGIPLYLAAVRPPGALLPLRASLVKFPATLITLVGYGSGGVVGPLGQINAGFVQWVTLILRQSFPRLFGDQQKHHHDYQPPTTAAICGLAAAIAAIFHSPIGAAVFAVEVIQKEQLRYHQIFPAILASTSAVLWANLFHWDPVYFFSVTPFEVSVVVLIPVVLAGLASGFFGLFYTRVYRFLSSLFNRNEGKRLVPKLVVSISASTALGILINPHILRTSNELIPAIFSGDFPLLRGNLPGATPIFLVAAILFLVKLVGNSITVAGGMSAGFTGPTLIIGMLGGYFLSAVMGFDPGSQLHLAMIAAGFAGMLASSMNVPLAAAILTAELFGPSYGAIGGISAIVGFQVARYSTIYDSAMT